MKIICYGVTKYEQPFFESFKKEFKEFELIIVNEYLTHDNINLAKGCEGVNVIANCVVDKQNLDKMKEFGVKYLVTRNAGTNHIDLEYAAKLGYKVANVPAYSPNAISEYAVTMGAGLIRNLFYSVNTTGNQKDFRVSPFLYSNEIRFSTIGVIGTGRIGYEVAKAYKGLGARVIGYDLYPNERSKEVLEYVDLDTLAKEADLVSIHCPYIPGKNDHMIDAKFLAKMKDGSFLVNAARGEVLDSQALYDALISNKLKSAAIDVVEHETEIFPIEFGKKPIPVDIYEKLHALYPRLLITPHIAAFTTEAIKNMVKIGLEDIRELAETGDCKNKVN